jgi:hypothetical protein
MLLRDFLYVDADKVRGLLAQLDEGIVEARTEIDHTEKLSGLGLKGLAEHSQRWGSERASQKSLGDALFPALEQGLESLGLLHDISDRLAQEAFWGARLRSELPPGTLVRISAPSALFDARYVAATLSAFATSWQGLANLGVMGATPPAPPKRGASASSRPSQRKSNQESEPRHLEDDLPDVNLEVEGDTISREFLQGIIRVARGMFTPGLHLNMHPTGVDSHVVTARLQEGRQFLDGDAEVLFARYGAGTQQWTMVGSIGHYGEAVAASASAAPDLVDENGNVNRPRFASFVNAFLSQIGNLGFIDVPAEPGFSVVPLAVYRVVGKAAGNVQARPVT